MNSFDEWSIRRVSSDEYKTIADPLINNIYNKACFNELNEGKTEEVYYLIAYKKESIRFSGVFGLKGDVLECPFSAPFGYMESFKREAGIEDYYAVFKKLEEFFLSETKAKTIRVYMPPAFYDDNCIAAWMNVFLQNGFRIECCDVNYSFIGIEHLLIDYERMIYKNARKNLHIALVSGLKIERCETTDEIEEAYKIIKVNRKSKGYPLHMSREDLLKMISIVENDIFIVKKDSVGIASAVVYQVNKYVAQVIYWGDIPGYSAYKPINYLSYNLLEFYKNRGILNLDVGISTDYGTPNNGLCDFKESIGCKRSNKYRIVKDIRT